MIGSPRETPMPADGPSCDIPDSPVFAGIPPHYPTLDGTLVTKPLAIDVFAGAGGMSLGFENAGFSVRGAVDVAQRNTDIYAMNFPRTSTLCGDISDLSGADLVDEFGLSTQAIDVLFGGPPCQGFSVGGRRRSDDPRNTLIGDFARLVHELQPRAFVMENVGGLLSSGKLVLKDFITRVGKAGYSVSDSLQLLDASAFGVPQRRRRLFVIGTHSSVGSTSPYPAPKRSAQVSVWDAISDLPEVLEYDYLTNSDRYIGPLQKDASPYARRLRKRSPERPHQDGLAGCARTAHSATTIRRFRETTPGEREPISRFIRLDPSGLAPTLRAGSDSRHGSFTAPRPIHPISPRCITVREAARLHSIPDWFELHPTKWHGFSQVGNAVPPLLAESVAKTVMSVLNVAANGDPTLIQAS